MSVLCVPTAQLPSLASPTYLERGRCSVAKNMPKNSKPSQRNSLFCMIYVISYVVSRLLWTQLLQDYYSDCSNVYTFSCPSCT